MKHRGFTLIELLIATSVLMLLMALCMYGYQLFNQQWNNKLSDFDVQYQKFKNYELTSNTLKSIVPYMVNEGESAGFYFLGRDNGFTAVSATSVFAGNTLVVFRVFKEKNEQGKFRLVYEEASLRNTQLINANQQLPFSRRTVLFDNQEFIDFRYQQRVFLDEVGLVSSRSGKDYVWHQNIDGLKAKAHPVQIEINLSGFRWKFKIADRATALKARYSKSDGI